MTKPVEPPWKVQREFSESIPPNVRLHMSPQRIPKLLPEETPTKEDKKPNGFWYDLEGEWVSWCSSGYRFGYYYYALDLDFSKILTIKNLKQFKKFEDEYKIRPFIHRWMDAIYEKFQQEKDRTPEMERFIEAMGTLNRPDGLHHNDFDIKWACVAEKHAGIEIPLFQRSLESKWYDTWDCSSGVVWDISAIKGIKLYAYYNRRTKEIIKV